MRPIIIVVFYVLLSACSGGSSSNEEQSILELVGNLDISELEGFWANNCIESEEFEGIYTREFVDYKSGTIPDIGDNIALGRQNFADINCLNGAQSSTEVSIPTTVGRSTSVIPIGIYTNSEGIDTKVLELGYEFNDSSRLAFYRLNDDLYFSFEQDGTYEFDYENPYMLVDD